jgi:hypothetical protein
MDTLPSHEIAPEHGPFLRMRQVSELFPGEEVRPYILDSALDARLGPGRQLHLMGAVSGW